jgi:hypothetical protein
MGRMLRVTLYLVFVAFVFSMVSLSRWLFLGAVSETEESIMETIAMGPKVKRYSELSTAIFFFFFFFFSRLIRLFPCGRFNASILASEGVRLEPMRRPRFPRSPRGDLYFDEEEIIILLFVPFFGDFFPGYRTVEK